MYFDNLFLAPKQEITAWHLDKHLESENSFQIYTNLFIQSEEEGAVILTVIVWNSQASPPNHTCGRQNPLFPSHAWIITQERSYKCFLYYIKPVLLFLNSTVCASLGCSVLCLWCEGQSLLGVLSVASRVVHHTCSPLHVQLQATLGEEVLPGPRVKNILPYFIIAEATEFWRRHS